MRVMAFPITALNSTRICRIIENSVDRSITNLQDVRLFLPTYRRCQIPSGILRNTGDNVPGGKEFDFLIFLPTRVQWGAAHL
jgi:hypothetical protein